MLWSWSWLVSASVLVGQTLAQQYTNPVLWEDLADLEVFRVDDAFYYTASTMHYSPGAPVLKSYDLVNWQYVGHSVPVLDMSPAYDLTNNQRAYVSGIYASSMRYRQSTKLFYWIGCIHGTGKSYVYTASAAQGPWTRHAIINHCYYDAGLLFDDNDDVYVAYGRQTISVAKLNHDVTSEERSQQVFTTPSNIKDPLEGSRFYHIKGTYYLYLTRAPDGQFITKSTGGPFGSYDQLRAVADRIPPPPNTPGAGKPHQGSLVDTQSGQWYYMGFVDAYPGGRTPVLAPVTWTSDGWPVVEVDHNTGNSWGQSYPYPRPQHSLEIYPNPDHFNSASGQLGAAWEWNHNPDTSGYKIASNGLTLRTVTVTDDLYQARNTLTHRIRGPSSSGTFELDLANMRVGDRVGVAMLRDQSSFIGVFKESATALAIVMYDSVTLNHDGGDTWSTTNKGVERARTTLQGTKVWLRAQADIKPERCSTCAVASFSYSTDGSAFTQLGRQVTLNRDWVFYMGYRFAVFNYATQGLGGSVLVQSFTLA